MPWALLILHELPMFAMTVLWVWLLEATYRRLWKRRFERWIWHRVGGTGDPPTDD